MKKYRFLALLLLLVMLLPTGAMAVETPKVDATAALLVDTTHNEVLYELNVHEKRYPASITKIMTAMLALEAVERLGLQPRNVLKQIRRKHIFTHIRWEMTGIYLEVAEKSGDFVWMTPDRIQQEAALPTAFRQFWEERENV